MHNDNLTDMSHYYKVSRKLPNLVKRSSVRQYRKSEPVRYETLQINKDSRKMCTQKTSLKKMTGDLCFTK